MLLKTNNSKIIIHPHLLPPLCWNYQVEYPEYQYR